ncbi:MAG: hypothetical protein MUC36_24930 [Planctomycetes bacterium]|jgi:hypothetical protein|nr:hypothetical protein [Planctomycetota bacterium]
MHRIGCRVPATDGRGRQAGVALLLALATTVVLSLLALSVLASREASVAVGEQVDARERAHRAALSGAEWAVAQAMDAGAVATSAAIELDDGSTVAVVMDRTRSPHVVVDGHRDGVVVRLQADLEVNLPPTPPHAWVSLSSTTSLSEDLAVNGSAHLNGGLPLTPLLPGKLRMNGNLFLSTSSTVGSSAIVHLTGTTTRGVQAIAAPTMVPAEIPVTATDDVPVTSYSGSTQLQNTPLVGIVRVALAAGETLELNNVNLNGTLVVVGPNSLLNRARLRLSNVTIQGGTALTGNLAVLAGNIAMESNRGTVTGVSVLHSVLEAQRTTINGMLVTTAGMIVPSTGFTITRTAGFVPDTPLGLRWGTPRFRLRWLDGP